MAVFEGYGDSVVRGFCRTAVRWRRRRDARKTLGEMELAPSSSHGTDQSTAPAASPTHRDAADTPWLLVSSLDWDRSVPSIAEETGRLEWNWPQKYGREAETAYRISKGVCQGINRERKCADTIGTVPGLAISNDKMKIYFPNKIYGSNFIKQHSETVMVWNYQNADCS